MKGSLLARIDVNNKEQRRTVIGGALLAQQLSGFAPNSQLSVLNFGSETYVLLEGGTLTCVKTDDERLTNGVNDMTSGLDNVVSELISALSVDPKEPIATLVGEEIVNGVDVQRYFVDSTSAGGKAFLSGLNESDNQFKQARLDLWIASEGDYLVKLELKATGKSTMMAMPWTASWDLALATATSTRKWTLLCPRPARM